MPTKFTEREWDKISSLFNQSPEQFDLPERKDNSVVIGTFNIRKLGKIKSRSKQSWLFLRDTLKRFDLIAVQEIMDDLSGFEYLLELLGEDYGMIVSDITGTKPGGRGNTERLGFLFNWKRIQRTALASDVTYDRSEITRNLYENKSDFSEAWEQYTRKLGRWEERVIQNASQGKRKPSKPPIELPRFVSFIRQPHCVSFRVKGKDGEKPYEFLIVNAHLLYGSNKVERKWEFMALIEWLTVRAKQADKLYHPNILLLGDCNLDFDEDVNVMRTDIDALIKSLNKKFLRSKKAATANFPLLNHHPKKGLLRTALRQKQTYDQIGFFSRDSRLPKPENNIKAGSMADGFDYGVFNIADLISNALHQKSIDQIGTSQRKTIYKKAEFDISDHMPAWVRLELPH